MERRRVFVPAADPGWTESVSGPHQRVTLSGVPFPAQEVALVTNSGAGEACFGEPSPQSHPPRSQHDPALKALSSGGHGPWKMLREHQMRERTNEQANK